MSTTTRLAKLEQLYDTSDRDAARAYLLDVFSRPPFDADREAWVRYCLERDRRKAVHPWPNPEQARYDPPLDAFCLYHVQFEHIAFKARTPPYMMGKVIALTNGREQESERAAALPEGWGVYWVRGGAAQLFFGVPRDPRLDGNVGADGSADGDEQPPPTPPPPEPAAVQASLLDGTRTTGVPL